MAENKTQKNSQDINHFISSAEAKYQGDCLQLKQIMQDITGDKGAMWGDTLVGFGEYEYTYASGKQGKWFLTGFSPRKQNLTIYIMPGFEQFPELMVALGKFKVGKSCLYVKQLADVDLEVLTALIKASVIWMKEKYTK